MNYFNLLSKEAKENKLKDFIILDGKRYTYEDVYESAKKLGKELKSHKGNNRNNSIFIYSRNPYFQLLAFFAISYCDDIPIILHHGTPSKVIKELAIKNNIKFIVSEDDFNIFEEETTKLDLSIKKGCMGVLTSGSSGIPKVLYRSYKSWVNFFPIQNDIFKITSNSKLFISGDFSFTGNLNVVMAILFEGATIVIQSALNPKRWVEEIEKERVTNIYLIPTKLKILSRVLNKDIESVNLIFTGSQLLFEEIADKLKKSFIKSEIILYYGASELNYITFINYDEIKRKPLSVGKAFPKVKIFIENNLIYVDTKYHVENIKSPYTVADKGYVDEEGYLIFQGRDDEVINTGGAKVSSIKIENEIKKISEIEDVAVIAKNNNIRGNEIVAFIVLKSNISKDYILKELRKNLLNIEIPKKIIFIDKIPINDIGKVNKKVLLDFKI